MASAIGGMKYAVLFTITAAAPHEIVLRAESRVIYVIVVCTISLAFEVHSDT